jgi:hypothetical protein
MSHRSFVSRATTLQRPKKFVDTLACCAGEPIVWPCYSGGTVALHGIVVLPLSAQKSIRCKLGRYECQCLATGSMALDSGFSKYQYYCTANARLHRLQFCSGVFSILHWLRHLFVDCLLRNCVAVWETTSYLATHTISQHNKASSTSTHHLQISLRLLAATRIHCKGAYVV